jgi:hypothetical protein
MSSYFVSAATIADAAFALKFDFPAQEPECVAAHDIVSLGRVLWQLNALAMWETYKEELGANLYFIAGYTQESRPEPDRSEWQRLKSLSCLIYQCAEGTVPDTDLFKAMEEAETQIAMRLTGMGTKDAARTAMNNRPEYDKASWGKG